MNPPDAAVWLVVGYAMVLLATAWGLDAVARRVTARAVRAQTDGFTYDADRDAWRCPHDQWLWPTSFDSDSRLKRYRAEASACNRCPAPLRCTGSLHGREISRAVDPWPHSATGRFYRGIACFVAGLGAAMPLIALIGGNSDSDAAVLIGAAVLVGLGGLPLARGLWRTPVDAPARLGQRSTPWVIGRD